MITYIFKLLKALNANTNPDEIAHATACGLLLGLMPKNNLLWYVIFVFILFIRINRATYLIMILIGSALASLMDPLFDSVGYSFLTIEKLYGTFAFLLDIPFVAFTKFNNTIVMGSLIMGLAFYVPVYVISRVFVYLWRKYAVMILRNSKMIKVLNQLPVLSKVVGFIGEKYE